MPLIQLQTDRDIKINAPPGHPNYGVVFQVIQNPTTTNPYLYVRRQDTGEIGFIEADRIADFEAALKGTQR